jgi:hypothetical protein
MGQRTPPTPPPPPTQPYQDGEWPGAAPQGFPHEWSGVGEWSGATSGPGPATPPTPSSKVLGTRAHPGTPGRGSQKCNYSARCDLSQAPLAPGGLATGEKWRWNAKNQLLEPTGRQVG